MTELSPEHIAHINARILALKTEHRDMDRAIEHLVNTGYSDELSLKRLKKRKLAIKDEIAHLKLAMMPDMPA
ncbi:MAG: YdcH family protein [Thermochromatium sp.]